MLVDQLFILSKEQPIDLALNQHLYERTPKVMTAATRADMLRILDEMPTDKRDLMLKRIGGMVINMLQQQASSTEA